MRGAGNVFSGMGVLGLSGAAALLLALPACRATVAGDPERPIKIEAHVTIDIRQIKEEAHSIEEMVSGGGKPAPKPHSRLERGWTALVWAEPELAPEVLAAIESRKGRYDQLRQIKARGAVGEDNQGHVAVIGELPTVHSMTAVGLQDLVEQENRDRETIYQAQVKQKGLPADAIGTIRAAFAQEQRERAAPGEKVQLPSGEWITK